MPTHRVTREISHSARRIVRQLRSEAGNREKGVPVRDRGLERGRIVESNDIPHEEPASPIANRFSDNSGPGTSGGRPIVVASRKKKDGFKVGLYRDKIHPTGVIAAMQGYV